MTLVGLDDVIDPAETRTWIARALSRPSLSVLSGELAIFSVGGEVLYHNFDNFNSTTTDVEATSYRTITSPIASKTYPDHLPVMAEFVLR